MEWERVENDWTELRERAMEQWDELTEEQLDEIDGQFQQLTEVLQEAYGITRAEAEGEISEFLEGFEHPVRMEIES